MVGEGEAGTGRVTPEGAEPGGWVQIPTPEPVTAGTVWHYTNTAGLIGILSGQKLWASSAAMLNDSSELEYGLEIFESVTEEFLSLPSLHETQSKFIKEVAQATFESITKNHIYVICASANGDDLGQWRGYSEGSGYAIGLRADVIPRIIDLAGKPRLFSNDLVLPSWHKVLYDEVDQRTLLRKALDTVAILPPPTPGGANWHPARRTGIWMLAEIISHLKHPGFEPEQEIRCAFAASIDNGYTKFRPTNVGLTPYIETAYGLDEANTPRGQLITTNQPGPLAITEICVGPAQDQRIARRGVETALEAYGYEGVQVGLSGVPYR